MAFLENLNFSNISEEILDIQLLRIIIIMKNLIIKNAPSEIILNHCAP